MANSKLTLTYFDIRGRAEVIRLLLHMAGKEFEDKRVGPLFSEEWFQLKPSTPFGQIPILEIDGKVYGQSLAIASFIAREFGLYGKTNLEALQVDQAVQLMEDLSQHSLQFFYEKDELKKTALENTFQTEDIPRFMGYFESLLKNNGTGYVAGNDLTLADVIFDMITGYLEPYTETYLAKFPLMKALSQKVGSHERIKAYLATRKYSLI